MNRITAIGAVAFLGLVACSDTQTPNEAEPSGISRPSLAQAGVSQPTGKYVITLAPGGATQLPGAITAMGGTVEWIMSPVSPPTR